MTNVVFVAPYFAETTLRSENVISAAASLQNVRLGLISQDPEDKLPESLRRKLAGHYRVEAGLSRSAIEKATRAMKRSFGSVDRLLGTLEQLQVPPVKFATSSVSPAWAPKPRGIFATKHS